MLNNNKKQETQFFGTKCGNANSIAAGYATETTNYGEIATGILNKSTKGDNPNSPEGVVGDPKATLFSVGYGTKGERKNALEVKGDGSVIISGKDGSAVNMSNLANNMATADEEDITIKGDTPQTQVLKLKDRAYDSLNASGKGYKILRKNWQLINGERKNVLTQEMINEPNTIYEIRYDFDLNGEVIEIQEGSTLNFGGGSFSNGTLLGRDTKVADIKCNDVKYDGTFLCDTLHINSNSFGNNINLVNILSHFTTLCVELETDIDNVVTDNNNIQNINLNGNGHTIRVPKLNFTGNVNISHVIFDADLYQAEENSESCFINSDGKGNSLFYITDCKFINLNGGAIFVVSHTNPKVNNCSFTGTLLDDSEKKNITGVVRLYKCSGAITINGNHIENCYGIGLNILSNTNISGAVIAYNYINKVTGGGIVSSGNILKNVECHDNIVKNVNHLSNETTGGELSAINIHGFDNLLLHDNYLESPKSSGIDLDGTDNKDFGRGKIFSVYNNKIVNCLSSAFFRVEDGIIYNNTFITDQKISNKPDINLFAVKTIFRDNMIVNNTTGNKTIILVSGNSVVIPLSMQFLRNKIYVNTPDSPDRIAWLSVNSKVKGTLQVLDNDIKVPNTNNQYWLNYSSEFQIQFLSCYPSIIKTINLSKANRIYLRKSSGGNFARLVSVRYCNYSKPTNSKELFIGIGLAKNNLNSDSLYGTFKIPEGMIPNVWTNLDGDIVKSNEIGDVYLYTPGGGDDIDVQIEVTFEPLDGISYH